MRDSVIRDRALDGDSVDGSVDKSVVNWLMHVISGKAPLELGINGAAADVDEIAEPKRPVVGAAKNPEIRKPESSKPTAFTPEIHTIKTYELEPEPELMVSAEDLCGAPIYPVIAAKPAHDEITADDLCFVPKSVDAAPVEASAPEPVRRATGPQLVELSRPGTVSGAEQEESVGPDAHREPHYGPPLSASTTAIAESLRARKAQSAQDVTPLEIARDPDEYEAIGGKAALNEVEWIPTELSPTAVETVPSDPFTAAEVHAEQGDAVAEPEVIETAQHLVEVAPTPDLGAIEEAPVEALPEFVAAEPDVAEPAIEWPAMHEAEPEVAPEPVVAQPDVVAEPEVVAAAVAPAEIPEAETVEAVPELVIAEPEVEGEPEAEAAPESQEVIDAEPSVVGEEIQAVPVAVASSAKSSYEDRYDLVAAHTPATEFKPQVAEPAALNGLHEGLWAAAQDERSPSESKFSAEGFYGDRSLSQPVKTGMDAELIKEMESKPENLASALKTLMQLGSVLPLAARMAPMFESSAGGEAAAGSNLELRQEVAGLRLLQYEIKTTVQDHSAQLKRLEEQLTQVRESVEMDSSESAAVMDSVKSTVKLVRVMGIGVGVMLMVLILMVGMMLVHSH